jgi:uncharacterized protein YndB with AHSA1/START domain
MTIDAHEDLSDAALGEVTVASDALQVVFHRRYAKPIEKVWAAVTMPDRLADWLAVAEVDLKRGGTIRLNWNDQYSMEGRITACEPPHVFAWSWPIDGRETHVRFELQSDQDGCLLTLTHSGLSPQGAGAGVRAGWHAHLEGIPDAIEGRLNTWATKIALEEALSQRYPALPV